MIPPLLISMDINLFCFICIIFAVIVLRGWGRYYSAVVGEIGPHGLSKLWQKRLREVLLLSRRLMFSCFYKFSTQRARQMTLKVKTRSKSGPLGTRAFLETRARP